MTLQIRPIDHSNRHDAWRVFATAFADDPVTRWAVADPSRDIAVFEGLDMAMHGAPNSAELVYDDGVPVGAAQWDPPGYEPSPQQSMRSLPIFARALRGRLPRGIALAVATARRRPKEPHWYLSTIGAVAKGQGIGSMLLRHRLEQIDGPAYLESSNIANNPLYERFGFEVTGEIRLPMNGPTLWTMHRR
jgi:GNAT superfamily N-acetyltransferase